MITSKMFFWRQVMVGRIFFFLLFSAIAATTIGLAAWAGMQGSPVKVGAYSFCTIISLATAAFFLIYNPKEEVRHSPK